jgi:phospholipid-binding lipoprotein MlaA
MTTPFVSDPFAPLRWRVWAALALAAVLTGCATGPTRDSRDPIEPFNRGVSEFNDAVDKAVLKPVATVYADVTPDPVRTAVGNFFANLRDVWTAVNATLQLRGEDAATSAMRVSVNTTFGFWGLLDLASELRLYRVNADFGQTLGYWGVPPGPYLVLPLLGPSTLRDTVGMGVEASGDLVQGISDVPTRNTLYTLRAVETRAGLLRAGAVLDEAALDKYSFTREVFLTRRQSAIDAQRNRDED